MGEKLMKSEANFGIHLNGKSEIDAELLSNILSDTAKLTKAIAKEVAPQAEYMKMNVTAFKNGSFEIGFSTICEITENLLTNAPAILATASQIVTTLKDIFEIKKFLKGEKPKSITNASSDTIQVTDSNNHSKIFNKGSGIVLKDANIENLTLNIVNNISQQTDTGFDFMHGDNVTSFSNDDIKDISKPFPIDVQTCKIFKVKADLTIKQADFLGKSQWKFKFNNKTIDAQIKDAEFLLRFLKGDMAIYAKDYITALLEIQVELDESGNPIDNSEKYAILEVYGDIKHLGENQPNFY